MNRTSKTAGGLLLLAALLACQSAAAYQANIAGDSRALYLRVGTGAMTVDGVSYNDGARPINFTGVQNVVVNVPASQVGNGTDLQMTGDGDLVSHLDNYLFCNPGQIYIGAFFRRPGNTGGGIVASVTANYSPNLISGGDTIPMSQIRWVSSGNGDGGFQPFASGSFTGSGQQVAAFIRNQWNESCLTFFYGNDQVVAAGSYTNTVTYTLSAP